MSADENVSSKGSQSVSELFHGKIILQSQEIPFAHFPHYASLEDVLTIMVKEWNLSLPKIMLNIVSDNASLSGWPNFKQQESFVKGLIKASNATSMWILTSGLNIGISKVIGDAMQADFNKRHAQICYRHSSQKVEVKRTSLIGLCSENLLTYNEKFKVLEKQMKLQNAGNSPEEQKFNLNPFHTHMLIIRDKSYRKDGSNRFLLKLEDAFRDTSDVQPGSDTVLPSSAIPIVAILIQGNLNSIHFILAHLKCHLPVLVIRGSGGLADVLAYAYYEVRRSFLKIKDSAYVETVLKKGLDDKITTLFPSLKDNKMARNLLCSRILECIECSEPPDLKHITVFNMLDLARNIENLPLHLLRTLFKSQRSDSSNFHAQLKKDLQLTIDWNCPELALTKVFYIDATFKVDNDIFDQALLERGREDFVSLFLDNGFELEKYLSAGRLVILFEKALKEDFFREVCWEGVLAYGKVVQLDHYFIDSDLNWIIESLIGISYFVSSQELNNNSVGLYSSVIPRHIAPDVAKRKAIIVLFIWALISNRGKLAICLWRHVDHPIMSALAASLILDKIKIYIHEKKTQDQIDQLSKEFASMAIGVFDLCYNDMPSKAYDLLNAKYEDWSKRSLIDMASLAENRAFVAHPCCQKWLTNKFMGNIKIRELTWGFMTFPVYIKVILCAFFVFPMYLWVRFKESTIHEFVGGDEYDVGDSFYGPQDVKEAEDAKRNVTRDEAGRTHLLKYQYPPAWQMIFWMWSAPITKFWVSHIFYILYLMVFSLAVIWPSCGNLLLDIIVCAWTSLIAVDSAHRLYSITEAFPNTPVFTSCLELVYMILFVLFYVLLRVLNIENFNDPYAGKILICMGLLWFYYRMIFIYLPISSTLGPLLYRAKIMISVDFVNYMKLTAFVLIGNAIAMQAVLYPDYPLKPDMIRKSFHKAFIAFFLTPTQELSTNPACPKWEQKPNDEVMCRVSDYIDGTCPTGIAFWPYVFVFQYVLLLKLILMTVLFALFNNTGAKLGPESNSIWKFQRYKLIVKFSNSLRLPPPINIFSVFIMLYDSVVELVRRVRYYMKFMRWEDKKTGADSTQEFLPSFEYNYWRHLANDYHAEKQREKEEEKYAEKELENISQLAEDVNIKEIMIYRAKSQITQLEADICYTHAHLETLKYRMKKDDERKISVSLHTLSRESPYPQTKIQRFPVPDKYVPWEVMWLHYEPATYTMPKDQFPEQLIPYVDEDILLLQEKGIDKSEIPVYLWNIESVDSNGVYRNRKSWIKDRRQQSLTYRLDKDNLPRNPLGRTGLRGKGALPRWGPNHNVFAVITRWQKKKQEGSDQSLLGTSTHLEFVETWYLKKKDLSLPGGFVWTESRYEVIQSVFQMDANAPTWMSEEDMIQFFRSHATDTAEDEPNEDEFKCEKVYYGYMDDQLNTDQAWKEVELWHVHYNTWSNLNKKFKINVKWRLLSEDVFIQLPYGQTTLLQDVIRFLDAKIAQI